MDVLRKENETNMVNPEKVSRCHSMSKARALQTFSVKGPIVDTRFRRPHGLCHDYSTPRESSHK